MGFKEWPSKTLRKMNTSFCQCQHLPSTITTYFSIFEKPLKTYGFLMFSASKTIFCWQFHKSGCCFSILASIIGDFGLGWAGLGWAGWAGLAGLGWLGWLGWAGWPQNDQCFGGDIKSLSSYIYIFMYIYIYREREIAYISGSQEGWNSGWWVLWPPQNLWISTIF